MKNIMLSGPDGAGKSTIISSTKKKLEETQIDTNIVWLRFHHYFAKLVNIFGRITGKSYREKHTWGEVGYHDYKGAIGIFYIVAVYLDHLIFKVLIKNKKIKQNRFYLIDRYILDIVADLIVDTRNEKFVFFMFDKLVQKELLNYEAFVLECDYDVVVSRREDIKDDKSYQRKIDAYKLISDRYNVKRLNTGENSIDEIVQQILNS